MLTAKRRFYTEGENNMRNSILVAQLVLGVLTFAGVPLISAVAHEEHKMECNETSMNAMHGDIQAMPDGKAKTKATQEMQMAEEMMAKKDTDGCVTHLHKAMEAMEE